MNATVTSTKHLSKKWAGPNWGIAALCLAVAFAPMLWHHFAWIWQRPEYQYFPFVLAAFAGMLFIRLRDASPHAAPRDRRVAVGAIAILAAIVLAAAVVMWSPWFAVVAAICMTASIFVHLHSRLQVRNLFGIWLFLWLLLPPPLNLDRNLIQYLQSLSSRLSSAVLDLLGINHVMLGNVLESASKQFFVDEACSGIVSVMSILAAGTIYAVYRNRSLWHLCWLLTLGVGMAVVMNLARIVVIAVAYEWWQWDLTTGTPHEILGLVLFLCTFGSLVCLDELLATMFGRIEVFETTEEKSRLVSIFNRRIAAAASEPPVTETPSSSNRPSIPRAHRCLGGNTFHDAFGHLERFA